MNSTPDKGNLQDKMIPAPGNVDTHCDAAIYDRLYQQSIDDPHTFWLKQAERIDWQTKPTEAGEWSFDPVNIKWYSDGVLNICHNAVDRHVDAGRGDVPALIFEPDDADTKGRTLTYAQLRAEVIRMAGSLKKMGVKKGDRVTIYMPMIPEGAIAMLACADCCQTA